MSSLNVHRDEISRQFNSIELSLIALSIIELRGRRNFASFAIYLFLVLRLESFEGVRADYTISNHQGDQRHVGEYASAEFPQQPKESDASRRFLRFHRVEHLRSRTRHFLLSSFTDHGCPLITFPHLHSERDTPRFNLVNLASIADNWIPYSVIPSN